MPVRIAAALLLAPCLAGLAAPARAQWGAPAPDAGPDVAAFASRLGVWDIRMHRRQDDGSYAPLDHGFELRVEYLEDGRTVLTRFVVAPPNPFFGASLRAWDAEAGLWRLLYVNAAAGRFVEGEIRFEGETQVTTIQGGYAGEPGLVFRSTETLLAPGRTETRFHESRDGERTWQETGYYFTAIRR